MDFDTLVCVTDQMLAAHHVLSTPTVGIIPPQTIINSTLTDQNLVVFADKLEFGVSHLKQHQVATGCLVG